MIARIRLLFKNCDNFKTKIAFSQKYESKDFKTLKRTYGQLPVVRFADPARRVGMAMAARGSRALHQIRATLFAVL